MPVVVGTNSYVTEAELIAYAALRGITVTSGDESILLIRAMDYIELFDYCGSKADPVQPLEWPRINATEDGNIIASDVVPQRVKDAQCEAAIRATSPSGLITDQQPGSITEETVGPITVKYSEYSNNGQVRYAYIERLLQPVLCNVRGMFQHKVVRT